MSTPYEVPFTDGVPQQITISLAGTLYTLTLVWNPVAAVWVLDIGDASNNPVLQGVPLVANVDLLEQYAYLGFGGQLVAQSDFDPTVPPTFTDLGSTGHLYFVAS